jgi:hypothetical protein
MSRRRIKRIAPGLSRDQCNQARAALARELAARRQRAKACFVIDTAREEGVHLAVHQTPRGPVVFSWAPGAPSVELQLECERSFKRAVAWNLREIRRIGGDEPTGRA